MREKTLFLSAIILSLVVLFVPGAFDAFSVITKTLFEGTSYAKTVLFLLWLVFLSGLAVLRGRGVIKPVHIRNSILVLMLILGVCWYVQLQLQFSLLFSKAEIPDSAIATVLVREGGAAQWESTQLNHMHITKGALYNLIWWFPLKNFDSGYPMHNLLPFPYAVLFLVLAFALGLLLVNEFLKNERMVPMVLLAAGSFGALVSVFDGGIFSTAGRLAIAMLVAFALYGNKKIKSHEFFLAPFLAVATVLYFGSFLFEQYPFIYGGWEILAIGIIASALLVAREKKILKAAWIVIALYLIYLLAGQAPQTSGASMFEGKESRLLIYGLPENLGENNLRSVLEGYGAVSNVELYEYIAFATITPARYLESNELQKKLVEELKPESYLFVVKGWDEHRAIVKSDYDLNHLVSVDSGYISFSREYAEGKEQIVGKSFFPVHFINLFVSNNLLFEKNVEVPLVFGIAK